MVMPIKTGHEIIYETMSEPLEVATEALGSGDLSAVIERRDQMQEFLKDNEWSLDAYKQWLRAKRGQFPTKRAITRNLVESSISAAKSKFKQVDKEEQDRRLSICKGCQFLLGERCLRCGCYLHFKSRLEAWNCPIGKW